MNKVDLPVFDGPIAPFPSLKYPLEVIKRKKCSLLTLIFFKEYIRENEVEEEQCLEQIEDQIHTYNESSPVAAVIVEPIQSEGGENNSNIKLIRV